MFTSSPCSSTQFTERGQVCVVALGTDLSGLKRPLGCWEGATENPAICEDLLADWDRRGRTLSQHVLDVPDGGKGIIQALKTRHGTKLVSRRCSIHTARNIPQHFPQRYWKEAHRQFGLVLE
jgi:transposase-like protein